MLTLRRSRPLVARRKGPAATKLIWLGIVPALLLTVLLGALAPIGAALFVIGIGAAVVSFALPLNLILLAVLIFSAFIAGVAEYFVGVSQAHWIPFILSLVACIRAVVAPKPNSGRRQPGALATHGTMAWFLLPAGFYLFIWATSSAINLPPLPQVFASAKNYLMMWGVLVAVRAIRPLEPTARWIWRSLMIIAMLQLPFVLYQRIFVANRIGNTASSLGFDAINGTFGGALLGGHSAELAMFTCTALAYGLVQWRDKQLSLSRLLGFALFAVPPLFVVEVKAVIVWLPLVFMLAFSAQIARRPFLFIFGTLGSLLLVLCVILVYRASYYAPGAADTLSDFFRRDLSYFYDPERFNPATRELGRISAIVHWVREARFADVVNVLIGYGPGASRGVSSLAVGTIAQRYSFYVDISSFSVLLWDVGLLGMASFAGMILIGAIESRRLARKAHLPLELRLQLEAGAIGLLLILSTLVYIRDAVDAAAMQFLMLFLLGQVLYARGFPVNARNAATMPAPSNVSAGHRWTPAPVPGVRQHVPLPWRSR